MIKQKAVFTLIATSIISLTTLAGTERGGGHLLESAFKASAINFAQELAVLPQSITNQHLKFTTGEFFSAAYGVDPKCATGEDLAFLKSEMKLAYVKNDNVVLLNCYKDNPAELDLKPDWENLLDSLMNNKKLSVNSKVLIAHEVLRTIGREGENSYLFSGSVAATYFELNKYESVEIRRILGGTPKTCWLKISIASTCGTDMTGYKGGSFINIYFGRINSNTSTNYCILDYTNTIKGFESRLVDPVKTDKHAQDLIDQMNNYGCFE